MKTKVKIRKVKLLFAVMMLTLFVSCNGIYDNITDMVNGEKIYSDMLDGVINIQIGYERVEIDLMKAGRIPSSQINMGKAKKTVIECADFSEPDHRRVIDSICSYVNITGLNQLKTYKFTIYTEDEYGNKSMPLIAEAKPFTEENRDALTLLPPVVTESTSAALLEWKDHLSSKVYNFYRYSYKYTDKDGVVQSGNGEGDLPSFFVENVTQGQDVVVQMNCRIVPKLMNDMGENIPILDTIDWQTQVVLNISQNAVPAIFLKTPDPAITLDVNEDVFPLLFSWVNVSGIDDYTLKISANGNFPDNETFIMPLGNTNEYVMDETTGLEMIRALRRGRVTAYWTVVPSTPNASVRTQTRQFVAIRRQPAVIGRWTFEDPSNLGKATVGQDLIPSGSGITSVNGPTTSDKAVRVSKGSFFKCIHGITPQLGTTRINDYTIMFYVKCPSPSMFYTLLQPRFANNEDATCFINQTGKIGISGTGYSDMGIVSNRWYRITLSASMGSSYKIYVDNDLVQDGNISVASIDSKYALDKDGVVFFGDNDGEDNEIDVAEVVMWDTSLEDDELQKYNGVKRLDRTGWKVVDCTDVGDDGVGMLNYMMDGNIWSIWHSTWQYAQINPPYYFVIDMLSSKNISHLLHYRRNGEYADNKTVQWYIGNSSNPSGMWTYIGEGMYTDQHSDRGGNILSVEAPKGGVKGRYLKLILPDSYRNCANISELNFYEVE